MAGEIRKRNVDLPLSSNGQLAFVLENVLTEDECRSYIEETEKMGYEMAMINVGGDLQVTRPDIRNNTRCIWDSVPEATKLWNRIKDFIPVIWHKQYHVKGLNERLRFLKYEPGEYFKPHFDGSYIRDNGERSFLTVQLYLNEGFKGGSTTFLNKWGASSEDVEVVPRTGSVLVFQHAILHEGSLLVSGRKYAMRTDVMYAPQ